MRHQFFSCLLLWFLLLFLPSGKAAAIQAEEGTATLTETALESELDTIQRAMDRETGGVVLIDSLGGKISRREELIRLIQLLKEKCAQNPTESDYRIQLAQAYEAMGDWNNALAGYKQGVALNPMDTRASRGANRMENLLKPKLLTHLTHTSENNATPGVTASASTWKETDVTAQLARNWGPDRYLALGWFSGRLEQHNDYYDDTDFSLARQGPLLHVESPLPAGMHMKMRLRNEIFSNNGAGYYQLDGDENLLTGYLTTEYARDSWWIGVSHERERDPEPVLDQLTGRTSLFISAKELTGIRTGWSISRPWEISGSAYYEQYETTRPDQFNFNVQITHRAPWLPGFSLALGTGYYTEEQETITNLNAGYQWRLGQDSAVRAGYQMEYAERDGSLLHQAEALCAVALSPSLGWTTRITVGMENGGDEDSFLQLETGLEFRFF